VSGWRTAEAPAKLNLALVVGPLRLGGKHEVATVLERLSLSDTIAVRRAETTSVAGFGDDTLVRGALDTISRIAEGEPRFEARIEKRIPVAAGLGGGSSDAAAALVLANGLLDAPLKAEQLHRAAASLGADVPFFLRDGAQLATGDGTTLTSLELPRDYAVLLALPHGVAKPSTAEVYAAFDARSGEHEFADRRAALLGAIGALTRARALGSLPRNDLASSPLADEIVALGAFRADVTGAGPVVYGLFDREPEAAAAATALAMRARTWIAAPG
jgi:4-diphosphocytidyl-2-C-methyl-D-erythritol kinase